MTTPLWKLANKKPACVTTLSGQHQEETENRLLGRGTGCRGTGLKELARDLQRESIVSQDGCKRVADEERHDGKEFQPQRAFCFTITPQLSHFIDRQMETRGEAEFFMHSLTNEKGIQNLSPAMWFQSDLIGPQ